MLLALKFNNGTNCKRKEKKKKRGSRGVREHRRVREGESEGRKRRGRKKGVAAPEFVGEDKLAMEGGGEGGEGRKW